MPAISPSAAIIPRSASKQANNLKDSKFQIVNAEYLKWLEGNTWLIQNWDGLFHFLFGDWPYNLSTTTRFGSATAAPAKPGRDGAFRRQSRGFMGQQWDSILPFQIRTWKLTGQILHPGAFTASFSHPRKQHRLATAQEKAGYIINPALYDYHAGRWVGVPAQLAWIYGSGKPNGANLSKIIDKQAGAERDVVGTKEMWGHNAGNGSGSFYANSYQATTGQTKTVEITAPATPLAETWDGWQYGSPLAPEIEPILIAQKPYAGKTVDSITRTGAGAINIHSGKIHSEGRFPGNLILTHHPECVRTGEKQIKNRSGSITGDESSRPGKFTYTGAFGGRTPFQKYGDEEGYESVPAYDCHPDCHILRMEAQAGGNKAHYFYQADWNDDVAMRLAATDPVFYHAKVDTRERNLGCANLPKQVRSRVNSGGLEREPRFAPTLQENPHPTLKPIELCMWIGSLFLPPAEYAPRRAIVPCSGTGSEAAGLLLAGWDEVVCVEESADYCAIAEARLAEVAYWLRWGQDDIEAIVEAYYERVERERYQPGLFDSEAQC